MVIGWLRYKCVKCHFFVHISLGAVQYLSVGGAGGEDLTFSVSRFIMLEELDYM